MIQRGDIVQHQEVADSFGIVIRRDFSGLIEVAIAPDFEKYWCAENKLEVVGHIDE